MKEPSKEQWKMAQKFSYVRRFETNDTLLPQCWIVLRIDGHHFTQFCDQYQFEKPNDIRCLNLMNDSARALMEYFPDIVMAYGQSDEYSFAFRPSTQLYKRRTSKLVSLGVSCFTAHFVMGWPRYFPGVPLTVVPTFDGRTVCYPNQKAFKDYFAWRQADCHINNLYNTCFWTLVRRGGLSNLDATERLKGTDAAQKNEILFTQFSINYAKEPAQFRKGTTLARLAHPAPAVAEQLPVVPIPGPPPAAPVEPAAGSQAPSSAAAPATAAPASTTSTQGTEETIVERPLPHPERIATLFCDIIPESFWEEHPELLAE
ncbi:putative tRNAHis guanylyltransferase Thg1 [Paratrimastix pyriformis]|uniref:tRNA(His) guanylyltransferase n=1 Tax=Paratrimastix pyriformis TaxID=342808 RepID=A0ABQ8UFG1_9EUKA|nr:putative tRNAHis guanylyltransferase Thg1 [Paratrimastix pyriformis]